MWKTRGVENAGCGKHEVWKTRGPGVCRKRGVRFFHFIKLTIYQVSENKTTPRRTQYKPIMKREIQADSFLVISNLSCQERVKPWTLLCSYSERYIFQILKIVFVIKRPVQKCRSDKFSFLISQANLVFCRIGGPQYSCLPLINFTLAASAYRLQTLSAELSQNVILLLTTTRSCVKSVALQLRLNIDLLYSCSSKLQLKVNIGICVE